MSSLRKMLLPHAALLWAAANFGAEQTARPISTRATVLFRLMPSVSRTINEPARKS